MSEINLIITTLKRQLKARGKTYADIANLLHLSEASIKRLFSKEDISLARLQKICKLIDIEILDLMELSLKTKPTISKLSLEQEKKLAKNEKLLLVATCILGHWDFDQIISFYDITEQECIIKLAQLDKMHIISLFPNNRIKLRISSNFDWIVNGPIQQLFQKYIQHDFLSSQFKQFNELLICKSGMLTDDVNIIIQQAIRRLADKFLELGAETVDRPLDQRHGSALVLALRPWVPAIFDQYKRHP